MFSLKSVSYLLILSVFILQSCSSNEIGESKDVSQDKIYQQFEINYTEGYPAVKIFSQFRFAGRNGTTLVLDKPSQISFDNEAIKVDSSSATGAYYQVEKNAAAFFKPHNFTFIDINNKKFENTFSFDVFKLMNIPVSISKKQDLKIEFSTTKLVGSDHIELSTTNTDSSFSITQTASDTGNFIKISAEQLKRQKGTELMLEATLHRSIPLQQNTTEGGNINIEYTLKPVKIKLTD